MRISARLAFAAFPLVCGTAFAGEPQQAFFTDVTTTAGVGNDSVLVEQASWGDYDGDGDPDLLLTGMDTGTTEGVVKLYRNDSSDTADTFTDVTSTVGLGGTNGLHVGSAFGDLDNDGDLDIYIVRFTGGADLLYRNDGGTFVEVAAQAGTTIERSSRGVVLLDANRDGWLDIFVNAIGRDILYINQGDLTFVDQAAAYGVDSDNVGVGAVSGDFNDDGWPDLFVGNRSNDSSVPNDLFTGGCGAFSTGTNNYGVTATGLGMGVVTLDYDQDGDLDLYWTTWPGGGETPVTNALYRNNLGSFIIPVEPFTDVAAAMGVADPTGWGISAAVGDVQNDGFEDIFVTNGFDASTTPSALFVNNAGTGFGDESFALPNLPTDARGAAWADYDGDGDLDLVVTADAGEATRLYRNDDTSGNHWVKLKLTGTLSNASAIGARVEIDIGTTTLVREVRGGEGRGNMSDLTVHVGLGSANAVDEVRVRWPSGHTQLVTVDMVDVAVPVIEDVNAILDTSECPCSRNADDCDDNATCDDTGVPRANADYTCTCNDGFTGDGFSCDNLDECTELLDDCRADQVCVDTFGSYTCACPDGFAEEAGVCVDIDECADGTHDCGDEQTCTNTDGGFTCACPDGYAASGADCVDVDECAEGTHDCGDEQTCTNTDGGFTCEDVTPTCPDDQTFDEATGACVGAGCSCSTATPTPAAAWLALAPLVALLRRRE